LYLYNYPPPGENVASTSLPLPHVKSTLLSKQGQFSELFRREQVPEHLAVEAGDTHLLEMSTDFVGMDSVPLLCVTISPKSLSGAGETSLKLLGGHSEGLAVDTYSKNSCR
jgi:hypothetical protein